MNKPLTGTPGSPWWLLWLAIAGLTLGGCSASKIPGVYRIDIQQGNVVTQDMLLRLEPGMSKRKVRFVLGTPLIADTFNANRWDYLYTFESGFSNRVQRRISVFFDGDRLKDVRGDVERAVVREAPEPRRDQIVPVEGPGEERGLFSKLNPFDGKKAPAAKPKAEEQAPSGGAATADEAAEASQDPSDAGPSLWDRITGADAQPPAAPDAPTAPDPGPSASPSQSGSLATSPPPSATDTQLEQEAGTAEKPGLFQRLMGGAAADPESEGVVGVPANPESAPEADNAGVAAAETEVQASETPPAEGGGLFSRIRDKFQLPDAVDTSGLLEVKPPTSEPGGSVGDN